MKAVKSYEDKIETLVNNFREQAEVNGFKVNYIELANLRRFLRANEANLKSFRMRSGAVAVLMYRLAGLAYNEIARDVRKLKEVGSYVSENYIMNTFHPERSRRFHGSVEKIVDIDPNIERGVLEYKFFA